ncbi:hypothetical protein [Streptomyces massasporeus]
MDAHPRAVAEEIPRVLHLLAGTRPESSSSPASVSVNSCTSGEP